MKGRDTERKWKISDILTIMGNILGSILHGKLLLRMKVDRYFPQVLYTALMLLVVIFVNLAVDNTLARMEDNKQTLKELEILHTQKSYELIMLNRRSNVSALLREKGSDVGEPMKPATIIR